MVKRFSVFVLLQEVFLVGAILWSFSKYPPNIGPTTVETIVALIALAIALSDVALFWRCRDVPWGRLDVSGKFCRVLIVSAIAFAIFLATFSIISLFAPSSLDGAIWLSLTATWTVTICGVVGVELCRESVGEAIEGCPDSQEESNEKAPMA